MTAGFAWRFFSKRLRLPDPEYRSLQAPSKLSQNTSTDNNSVRTPAMLSTPHLTNLKPSSSALLEQPSANPRSARDCKSSNTSRRSHCERARRHDASDSPCPYEIQPRLVSSSNDAKLAAIRDHLDGLTRHFIACLNRKDSVDSTLNQHLSPAISCLLNDHSTTSRAGHLNQQRELWSRCPRLHAQVTRLAVYLDENVLGVLDSPSASSAASGAFPAAAGEQSSSLKDSCSSLEKSRFGEDGLCTSPVSLPSPQTADAEVWVDLEVVGEPAASIVKEGVYALHWRLPSGRNRWTCTQIRGLRSAKLF